MKTEMLLKRVGGSLHPYDEVSWDRLARIRDGDIVLATIRKGRNPEHLKKYWAVLRRSVQFDPEYDHEDDLDSWVRLSIPWMRHEYRISDGRVVIRLKSIALDEMDQTEFDRFYTQAIELITLRIGRDPEERDDAWSDGKFRNAGSHAGTETV